MAISDIGNNFLDNSFQIANNIFTIWQRRDIIYENKAYPAKLYALLAGSSRITCASLRQFRKDVP